MLHNPFAINEELGCNPEVGQKEKGNCESNFLGKTSLRIPMQVQTQGREMSRRRELSQAC